jgi:hypothetical protein
MTYRKPTNLDPRITDELYEKLIDIAKIESDAAIAFGMFDLCFERAVIAAARETLNASGVQSPNNQGANLSRGTNFKAGA